MNHKPPADWSRYAIWRKLSGDTRSLYEAPGHEFDNAEQKLAAKAVEYAIVLGWDAALFSKPLMCLLRFSHDDFIEVHCRREPDAEAIADDLEDLGLRANRFQPRRPIARN